MAHTSSLPFDKVVTSGIGLAFVAYPKGISMLPMFPNIFGIIFFGILVIAGLSSAISILEAFTSAIIDKFKYSRKVVVSWLSLLGFLGGIIFTTQAGIHWLDIVDHFLTQYGLVLAAILECILVGWIYDISRLRDHINHYSVWHLGNWWEVAIKILAPLVLVTLFVSSLWQEIQAPYGGYSWMAIIMIGRDWLIYTLFFAIVVASRPWQIKR